MVLASSINIKDGSNAMRLVKGVWKKKKTVAHLPGKWEVCGSIPSCGCLFLHIPFTSLEPSLINFFPIIFLFTQIEIIFPFLNNSYYLKEALIFVVSN